MQTNAIVSSPKAACYLHYDLFSLTKDDGGSTRLSDEAASALTQLFGLSIPNEYCFIPSIDGDLTILVKSDKPKDDCVNVFLLDGKIITRHCKDVSNETIRAFNTPEDAVTLNKDKITFLGYVVKKFIKMTF